MKHLPKNKDCFFMFFCSFLFLRNMLKKLGAKKRQRGKVQLYITTNFIFF